MRPSLAAIGLAALGGLAAAGVATSAPPPAAVPLEVTSDPGAVTLATRSLGEGALRVQRRSGRIMQVHAPASRAGVIADLPGVASVREAPVAFPDAVLSQGVARTGAAAFERLANGGEGLTIAILDLGFGAGVARIQAAGELPPTERLEFASFDPVNGPAGLNAYGNRTNHGELVAQTVYDYAPRANYVFVNYRTNQDFLAAVDWLIQRRPDIVVHSNNFLEGPFDGTGPEARAVDRAAAAEILWFNSAGNYAQKHWTGPWRDADEDAIHEFVPLDWTFTRAANQPITFAVSWTAAARAPGAPAPQPTDLSLALERQGPDGTWESVVTANGSQVAGARPSEEFVGYLSPVDGTFRVRIRLVDGPAPAQLTLLSREVVLAPIGGGPASSVPTPADSAGSVTVGAVDWRGDGPKAYSSQGPTDDGRAKPDLVAPTNTSVLGPDGPRGVGGTSNAAPNAAGAAAALLSALRRVGDQSGRAGVLGALLATPLDLGAPGPDPAYGAGRVRIEADPPTVTPTAPVPFATVRARLPVTFTAADRSPIATWSGGIAGVLLVREQRGPTGFTIDTRRLPDGWHQIRAVVRDWPGNDGLAEWWVRVDNSRPALAIRRLNVLPRPRLRPAPRRLNSVSAAKRRRSARIAPRGVRLTILARDAVPGPQRLGLVVRDRRGEVALQRSARLAQGTGRQISLGRLPRGRYRLAAVLVDRAGNRTTATRAFVVS